MKRLQENFDFAVIGGGLAGTVAAIAAARLGLKTVLVQNRPVLGGPSSAEYCPQSNGEIVNGASEYVNRAAVESGILEELRREASFRYVNGWRQHWSIVLREWCEKEPQLTLYLNTEVYKVEVADNRILAVWGRTLGSELDHVISAPQFADCTGDSFVGYSAGARYRQGRESRQEFHESLAPEQADKKTMGSSIAFRAIDLGHPVEFHAPDWAYKIHSDAELPYRLHSNPRQGYWWLEYGGEIDTIHDNEKIYRTLLAILYGVWDHVKNGGDHGAANYAINWISSVAGKRESRRLIGDYILNQNDTLNHPPFPDTVAYSGWPLDVHPPQGIFYPGHPGAPPPFIFPGIVPLPYRLLYSCNIQNLQMAGRNISVTHVALGTTRVMGTCALCGQVIGTAAALCQKYHCTPRELDQQHINELKNLLYNTDLVIPGQHYAEPATFAQIHASSEMFLKLGVPESELPLIAPEPDPAIYDPCRVPPADRRRGQMFPVVPGELRQVKLLFNNYSGHSVTIKLTLYESRQAGNFSGKLLGHSATIIPPGKGVCGQFDFNLKLTVSSCFILVEPQSQVSVCTQNRHLPGCYCKPDNSYFDNQNFCFELVPNPAIFSPQNVDGTPPRAGLSAHMWISDPGQPLPQTLTLELPQPRWCAQVEIIFDTNMDKKNSHAIPPECVKSYRLEALNSAGQRELLAQVAENHHRICRHQFAPREIVGFQLTVLATHGDLSARVYNFRIIN